MDDVPVHGGGRPREKRTSFAIVRTGSLCGRQGRQSKPQMVRKMRGWGSAGSRAVLRHPLYLLATASSTSRPGCWIAVSFGARFPVSPLSTVVGMLFFLASLVFGMAFYSLYRVSAPSARWMRACRSNGRDVTNVQGRRSPRCGVVAAPTSRPWAWVSQWCSRSRRGGSAGGHLSAQRALIGR